MTAIKNYQWPALTIAVMTYNRPMELDRTIRALMSNLSYPNLRWIISDDCSPDPKYPRNILTKIWTDAGGVNPDHWLVVKTPSNNGWGANANNAIRHTTTPYVFFCEDDNILIDKIDLRPGVALMECNPKIGLVRYDGLAGHRLNVRLDEFDISPVMPAYRQGCGWPGMLFYMTVLKDSPSLNKYSNRPHLKSVRFHRYYGAYVEGWRLGATEESFAHQVEDMMNEPEAPQIVCLDGFITRYFDDIGRSWQHTSQDKGNGS